MTVRVCGRLNIDAVRSVGNNSWRLKDGYRRLAIGDWRLAIKMGPAHFLPHRATVNPPTYAASLLPLVGVGLWPGRAKAEIKLVAVNQSSRASQQGKFRADHQGPLVAGTSQRGVQVGPRRPVIQGGPAGQIPSGSPGAGFGRQGMTVSRRSRHCPAPKGSRTASAQHCLERRGLDVVGLRAHRTRIQRLYSVCAARTARMRCSSSTVTSSTSSPACRRSNASLRISAALAHVALRSSSTASLPAALRSSGVSLMDICGVNP